MMVLRFGHAERNSHRRLSSCSHINRQRSLLYPHPHFQALVVLLVVNSCQMSVESNNLLISIPSPTSKKVRTELQNRITNLAVPIRLHIYGFLNDKDVKRPVIYGRPHYVKQPDPMWPIPGLMAGYKPYFIETAFSAMMGDCEVLQYLQGMPSNPWSVEKLSNNIPNRTQRDDLNAFFYLLNVLIVGYNNIKTLRYARRMLFPWNEWAFDAGIRYGVDLHILKWMHREGCPFSDSTFGVAASWRNTDVLDWLLSSSCPMSGWSFDFAISANCKLENLTWLRSHGCPWGENFLPMVLTRNDSLAMTIVQYLIEEKFPWTNATLYTVITFGNVSHLKLFHEANIMFNESHFLAAIRNFKPIEFLQYLLKFISKEWDANTFNLAVNGGNLSLLKWLKEEGCTWDTTVFITAVQTGHREIIRWLYEENCPMNKTAMDELMVKFVYNRYDSDKEDDEEEEEEDYYDEGEEEENHYDEEDYDESNSDNDETGDY